MARRPLAASRRNPLTVIEPSGYAKTAATARRSGVSSPTSLRAGMWRGFLTQSALAFAISLKEKNIVLGRPANILPTSLPSIRRKIRHTAGVGWIEIGTRQPHNHLAASVLPFVGQPCNRCWTMT
jgi:hypothetical protein